MARDRALYMSDVRFTIVMNENGKSVARQFTYQKFADMADPTMVKNGYYEHEIHRVTHSYGDWCMS